MVHPLVHKFLNQIDEYQRRYYSRRDNCGPAALDFIEWARKTEGLSLTRIKGKFKVDEILHEMLDFTPAMKKEFRLSGKNWFLAEDRKEWLLNSPYASEWHYCPHYWVVDNEGVIYDPSGLMQFVESGLSADLENTRYFPKKAE